MKARARDPTIDDDARKTANDARAKRYPPMRATFMTLLL